MPGAKADLIYIVSKDELRWPAKKLTWKARSGPHGLNHLPAGLYEVARDEITPYTEQIDPGFRDKSGKGFFVPLYPKFKESRDGFGVHPDGNDPGTEGCIGISKNAKKFHDEMAKIAPGKSLTLRVRKREP